MVARVCQREKLNQKNAHPERYINKALLVSGKFLEDLQRYEYDITPETPIQKLFMYWNNYLPVL